MEFKGTFINPEGRKVERCFKAPSEAALLKELRDHGWGIVSYKFSEEIISTDNVFQGLWVFLKFLWRAGRVCMAIIAYPIAFFLVLFDWLGKREQEKTNAQKEAVKQAQEIVKKESQPESK